MWKHFRSKRHNGSRILLFLFNHSLKYIGNGTCKFTLKPTIALFHSISCASAIHCRDTSFHILHTEKGTCKVCVTVGTLRFHILHTEIGTCKVCVTVGTLRFHILHTEIGKVCVTVGTLRFHILLTEIGKVCVTLGTHRSAYSTQRQVRSVFQ
jgi:hypothetical protein